MALVLDPFGVPRGTAPAKASTQAAPNKTTAAKQTVLKQTTPTKTVVTPDPYAAALAAQPSLATLLAQASTQANTLAQQQVNAQVKAITDQQAQAHATAAAQSAEILKAATAAAQFLTPLGDQAAGDYTAAVQNLGGMVGGYTGGLRDTAQAAQDAAQAQLASIPGNAQTVEGHGADLANLLYGVSGSIPANALATQGLGATALARAIPQQTLSYGQQQAIGQIGAGNTAADALNTQLASARAQLPTLTSQYLTQFQTSARDAASSAHQALMDANTIRNTTSEIAARTATGKRLTKAAADKAKADALKNAPHIDVAQSKLTGILTSQFGKPITKTVGGKQFLQTLPGFHFDNRGQVVPDPKPVTIDRQMALAAEWTRVNHYQSQWNGDPVGGKITPTGGWVVSPDGQSAVPPTKPGKTLVPKPDRFMSEQLHRLVYLDPETGMPQYYRDANKNTIPYDPGTKPSALKLIKSGGVYVWADPNTGKAYSLSDAKGVPLTAGTPATVRYGKPYIGANGNFYNTDPATGIPFDTGQPAPASAIKSEGTWSNLPADKFGHIYRINNKTNEIQPITGYQGRVPGSGTSAAGGNAGPGSSTWRLTSNRVDTQLQSWMAAAKTNYTYDFAKNPPWQPKPGGGQPVTINVNGRPVVVPASTVPKQYDEALQWALDQYSGPNTKAWQAHARKLVNDAYPMNGENGRPLEGGLAIAAANDYAKAMLKRGATADAALTAGLAQPYWRLDPSVLRKAISRIYPTPPSPLPPLGTIPTMPAGVIGGPPSAYAIP